MKAESVFHAFHTLYYYIYYSCCCMDGRLFRKDDLMQITVNANDINHGMSLLPCPVRTARNVCGASLHRREGGVQLTARTAS